MYKCSAALVAFTQAFFPPSQELQDQIDELHSELEEYRAQGKVLRPSLKNSLSEEFDIDMKSHGNSGIEPDQGKAHLLYDQLLGCRYLR